LEEPITADEKEKTVLWQADVKMAKKQSQVRMEEGSRA
jgi:hypothetical protein